MQLARPLEISPLAFDLGDLTKENGDKLLPRIEFFVNRSI
jgi:hypothetical protein